MPIPSQTAAALPVPALLLPSHSRANHQICVKRVPIVSAYHAVTPPIGCVPVEVVGLHWWLPARRRGTRREGRTATAEARGQSDGVGCARKGIWPEKYK